MLFRSIGVPYTDFEMENAEGSARRQALVIAEDLKAAGAPQGLETKEIVALIAYLQSLGQTSLRPSAQK